MKSDIINKRYETEIKCRKVQKQEFSIGVTANCTIKENINICKGKGIPGSCEGLQKCSWTTSQYTE